MPSSWEKTCCHLQVRKGPIATLPASQDSDDSCVPGPLPIQSSVFPFSISPFAKKTSDALSGPSPPSCSPYSWVQRVLNREELQWGMKWNKSAGKQQRKLLYFLICRYHFGGLWGKFSLFVLKRQCCGKGARGGGGQAHSPLLAAQPFFRKQLIKDRG